MQTQNIVSDLHTTRIEPYILHDCTVLLRQGEVFLDDPGPVLRTDDFSSAKLLQMQVPALIDNADELPDRIHEHSCHFRVPALFGNQHTPT